MAQPYVGEIRMAGFDFAPPGWLSCDGSLLSIVQYEVLYALVGTTYGGDGQTTFALPDLRGRVPVHAGQGPGLSSQVQGRSAGSESVTVLAAQMPGHSHALTAASQGTRSSSALGNRLASGEADIYSGEGGSMATLAAGSIGSHGNTQPHDNMQPSLCVNFIIAVYGIFPSQA